ncbi:MAG: RHS repeat-associated core domain-containing protein [Candidatus Acidiferrum sp.]
MSPTTKNQLEDTNGDYVYDAAGNLTQPGPIGGPYVYDAENHLTSADGVTYTYDGDGNRVMKSNGTIYWYGANSASLEESDLSGNLQRWYYFFNGQRVGRGLTTNEVGFYMTDALGSVRYLGGSATGYRFDYFPFGAPILDSDTGDDRYQFTGKERDSESGLDDFDARYYSSSMGRFMSPDDPDEDQHPANPQSWNLYTYVRNNPLNNTDPTGKACVSTDNNKTFHDDNSGGQSCADAAQPEKEKFNYQGGSQFGAFFLNLWFSFNNHANDYFRPITNLMGIRPSYMENTPTGEGVAASAAVGLTYLGEFFIGPEGEVVTFTEHATEAMAEHNVTKEMVKKAVEVGQKFYDKKNQSIVYVIKKGMASGKDLAVAKSVATGKITTVMVNSNAIRPRFQPIR